jgi:ABC-2 type transport system ATP-binding protein
MQPALSISGLGKTYASGVHALSDINLEVSQGEIFALLGPNGAGKTTLISIICGIVTPTSGSVQVEGGDIQRDFRSVRARIGLVPQELTTDSFETVWATVKFSRALFGCPPNSPFLEQLLRDLSLWDKRSERIMNLSGGMKRRVMIAKALSHEPKVLFLDEPTAGVDVELRRDMWALVRGLRDNGVTIILTTHYIEEAEEMADRVGVVNKGRLILVEQKSTLMRKLGKKQLSVQLQEPLKSVPTELQQWPLSLNADGNELQFVFDSTLEHTDISALLRRMSEIGLAYKDLNTRQSSLEDIFVSLISDRVQEPS